MAKLCLGTAQLGFDYGVANQSGQPNSIHSQKIVQSAYESGIRYFDTANSYGESESVLGNAFETLGISNSIHVITKLPPNFQTGDLDQLANLLEETKKRLKVESLYGLLAHRDANVHDWGWFKSALSELSDVLTVDQIGISLYDPDEALEYAHNAHIDLLQIPMNIMDNRLLNNGFFDTTAITGKQVFIRSIFLQGLFFLNEKELISREMDWAIDCLRKVWEYTTEKELSIPQFAWKAIIQTVPDAVIIFGSETIDQLQMNLELDKSPDIDEHLFQDWWPRVGEVNERLVTPSLW